MKLFTKCILKKPSVEDGVRISVMSRHTLNDGKTPDSRIHAGLYDIHMNILGPSPKLVGSHYKRNLPWLSFENAYLEEIRVLSKAVIVKALAHLAQTTNVSLLCIEETADECHRRLLAEECKRYYPDLEIEHR